MKNIKSKEKRIEEVNTIKDKLDSMGLLNHSLLEPFHKDLNTFIEGYSISTKVKLTGLKRILIATLTLNPRIESSVMLKYDENI